jgi:hypothetical protein
MMIRHVLSSGAYVKRRKKMKPIKYGIILLALLLAAMAIVPFAGATGNTLSPGNMVTVIGHADSSTPWNATEAKSVEAGINKILKPNTVLKSGFSPQILNTNCVAVRTDTLPVSYAPYATASGTFTLYKENVNDPTYDYFILWMKATGVASTGTAKLKEVRPGIILDSSLESITDWDPYTDTSVGSPTTMTANIGVSHNGISAGLSESYLVYQGLIGVQSMSVAPAGYYYAHWKGTYQGGSQGIISGVEFRTPKGSGYSYHYSLSLDASA